MNVAFTLPGAINIYTFSLLLAFGAAAGLTTLAWLAKDDTQINLLNASLWTLTGALIAGRLLYVGLQWPYFQSRLIAAIQVYRGGLSWAGALIGGIATIYLIARFSQRPFAELADALIPLFFTVSLSAWLGCWLTGCAYGQPSVAWPALPAMDEWGLISSRVPVQLIAILLSAAVFWLIYSQRASFQTPGQAASLFLLSFSSIYFLLTYLRGDPSPVWAGLRWDAWAALIFSALGLAYFQKSRQPRI